MTRSQDSGVALLEMLIALMIMAMLATMTATALGALGRVLNGVTEWEKKTVNLISQRQVQNWARDSPNGLNQGEPIKVLGDGNSFQFQTVDLSGRYWKGDLVTIEIRLENENLVARITGKLNPTAKYENSNLVLDHGPISTVEMSYFGRHELDAGPRWGTEWKSEPRLPDIVKIEWQRRGEAYVPLILELGLNERQTFRSRSSLSPPG